LYGRKGGGGPEEKGGLIGQRLNRCAVEGDLEKGMLLNSSRRDAGLPGEGLLLGCWFDGWMDSLECSSGAGAGPPDLKLGPWRKRRRRWFEEVGIGAG
jgi:hypothetical protein